MQSHPVQSEPMLTMKPSEPHSTHNTDPAQSTNQPHQPEPSMYPTLDNEPSEPRVFSTFYIEFGLFDDIDAIHSMQLEREMNEKLEGIWVTDPSIVYDKGENAA